MEPNSVLNEMAIKAVTNNELTKQAGNVFEILFPYAGRRRKVLDLYEKEIEKSNLPTEVKIYALLNAKRNIKAIKNQAKVIGYALDTAKPGTDFSINSKVNQEWLERFIDSSGYVSDEEVQRIWGAILAKEFEEPNSTPPNMRRILTELNPRLAQVFRIICSMKVVVSDKKTEKHESMETIIVPYQSNEQCFRELGLCFEDLNELDTMGLIKYSGDGYVLSGFTQENATIEVGTKVIEVKTLQNQDIVAGNVLLTNAGKTLRKITPTDNIGNFVDLLKKYYEAKHIDCKIIG